MWTHFVGCTSHVETAGWVGAQPVLDQAGGVNGTGKPFQTGPGY